MRECALEDALRLLDWLASRRTLFSVFDLQQVWPEAGLRTLYRKLQAIEAASWCEAIEPDRRGSRWGGPELYRPTPPVVRKAKVEAAA